MLEIVNTASGKQKTFSETTERVRHICQGERKGRRRFSVACKQYRNIMTGDFQGNVKNGGHCHGAHRV